MADDYMLEKISDKTKEVTGVEKTWWYSQINLQRW